MRKPDGKITINLWAYVNVFSIEVWAATFASVFLGSLSHSLSRHHEEKRKKDSFLQDVGAVSAAYIQRDSTLLREILSYRLVHVVNCLTGFIIFTFYSGVLTSLMTAPPTQLDIDSFQATLLHYLL